MFFYKYIIKNHLSVFSITIYSAIALLLINCILAQKPACSLWEAASLTNSLSQAKDRDSKGSKWHRNQIYPVGQVLEKEDLLTNI